MEGLRKIVDNAQEQLTITLPPSLHHRRLEVIVLPVDEAQHPPFPADPPPYLKCTTKRRVILSREALHES